ncbi:MAG: CoA transferase [Dehalococcoidia bacterium]|nr:CoA transferase [Dehalococcoidia bacterium]
MRYALDGIRVLDLSQMWATPGAAMYLADQGADVVKVEPLWGDDARRTFTQPPLPTGDSRAYLVVNRNKKGLALDITKPEGRDVALRLADRSDVLLHNFRPGVVERLGLGYAALRKRNPRLVYVWVTPYGRKGPYASWRGYDRLFQALSGVMGRRRLPDGTPQGAGVWVSDMAAPMLVSYGVALALLVRERTGRGQMVDTSLLQVAIAMQAVEMVRLESERRAAKTPGPDLAAQAMFGCYRCADDRWLTIVVISDKEWRALCKALDVPDMADDPAYATSLKRGERSDDLYQLLSGLFETRPRDAWMRAFREHDVPGAPVLDPSEVYDHPQVVANRMFTTVRQPEVGPVSMFNVPLRLSETPGRVRTPAPLTLGRHTAKVLAEAGYTPAEVRALRKKGVVK